jgi:CHAT domain-containing protein/lipopolysaccharide biosynthesis regulator YciM
LSIGCRFQWLKFALLFPVLWGLPVEAALATYEEGLHPVVNPVTSEKQNDALRLQESLDQELTRHNDGSGTTYWLVANALGNSSRNTNRLTVAASDENTLRQTEQKAEADRLLQQGSEAFRTSQFQTALDSWQSALEIYRDIGDRQGEANALGNLGAAYNSLGGYQQAVDFLQRSLTIYREIGDRQREAVSLGNLGNAYYRLGDYQQAIDLHQQALAIARETVDQQAEMNALGNLGSVYNNLGQYQQAIDFQQQALAITREIGDRQVEASLLGNLGATYQSLGDYQQAIDFHQKSLSIAREIGDRQVEANALEGLGNDYYRLGKYQQAIDFHQQRLAIAREIGDRLGESNSLGNLGITYQNLGEYQQAIDFHQQSLSIAREIGNRLGEASSLGNLGNVYNSLGDYPQAIDFHGQSLDIDREIGNLQGEANSLGNLGNAYHNLGDYQRAIAFHQQLLTIAREIGDRHGESVSLGNLGSAYDSLGDYQRAIAFHQQTIAIAREIGDRHTEAAALENLGSAYDSLEDYQQAIDFHQQSLTIVREIGDRQGESVSLGNLGNAYSSLGDDQQAIDFFQQFLAIAREINDRRSEGAVLGNLGSAYGSLGDTQKAIDFFQQSLAVTREIGDRQGEANSLRNLGVAYLNQEQNILAEDSLLKSVDIFDSLRSNKIPDRDRINFFETQADAYRNLELALVLQNKFETALEISERGRARSFVQLLSEKLSSGLEGQELAQSPNFNDIQRIASEQQSVLVEYSVVGENASGSMSLYIWLVQPTGELHFRRVPIGNDLTKITELVEQSRKAMGIRGRGGFESVISDSDGEDAMNELRELHQLLIEPIADLLPSDPERRVVFVPQGELFLVPFPALRDESGAYLIEQHTILTAPSIQVLDLTRQQSEARNERTASTTDSLIVGNPVMPEVWNPEKAVATQLAALIGAEQEAQAIGSLFNTEALLGAQATEQAVKQQIGNARIVHLATHGLLEYGTPEDSGVRDVPGAIALAPSKGEDGLLTSAEILELKLQADLVVLSACDTGLGTITGDGVIGLSRSLIAAGTPSVIVSLWSIPDAPTAELMTEFYRQRQQGKDKAQALRQAMLVTMKSHPNPGEWAAFTLIGEAN